MNFAPTLTIGILAASLYAAECNVTHAEGHSSADISQGYLATALYLFEGSYLDMSNMDKRDPAVVPGGDVLTLTRRYRTVLRRRNERREILVYVAVDIVVSVTEYIACNSFERSTINLHNVYSITGIICAVTGKVV